MQFVWDEREIERERGLIANEARASRSTALTMRTDVS